MTPPPPFDLAHGTPPRMVPRYPIRPRRVRIPVGTRRQYCVRCPHRLQQLTPVQPRLTYLAPLTPRQEAEAKRKNAETVRRIRIWLLARAQAQDAMARTA